MKKGQLSTEYLVILAVVVVVALIVVTVLGGFIDLGGGATVTASKAYWRSADIGMTTWRIVDGAVSTLVIRNNQDYTVEVTAITVGGEAVVGGATTPGPITLSPGKTATVTETIAVCTAGNDYILPVVVTYTDITHNIVDISFTGVKNIEGTC